LTAYQLANLNTNIFIYIGINQFQYSI